MFLQLTLLNFLSTPDNQEAYPFILAALNDEVTGPLIRKFVKGLVVRGRIALLLQHNPTALRINSFSHEMDKILLQPATTTKAYAIGRRTVTIPEHYQRRHRIQLQFPELPCLIALGGLVRHSAPPFQHEDTFPLELLLVRCDGSRQEIEDFMSRYAHRWAPTIIHPFNHLLVESRPATPSSEDDDWGSAHSNASALTPDAPATRTTETQTEPSPVQFVHSFTNQNYPNKINNHVKKSNDKSAYSRNPTNNGWGSNPAGTRQMGTSSCSQAKTSALPPVQYFPSPSFAAAQGFGTPPRAWKGSFGHRLLNNPNRGEVFNGKYIKK